MNRHVMPVPQTSLQGSCKLGGWLTFQPISADGANLLHGSDLSHHPELDHQKPKANRLGYLGALRPHGPDLGHLQIRRPLKLRSQAVIVSVDHLCRVDAGAAHPANARSVTRASSITGKPVDNPGDVLALRKCGGRP